MNNVEIHIVNKEKLILKLPHSIEKTESVRY
jgi:hypothetical protein